MTSGPMFPFRLAKTLVGKKAPAKPVPSKAPPKVVQKASPAPKPTPAKAPPPGKAPPKDTKQVQDVDMEEADPMASDLSALGLGAKAPPQPKSIPKLKNRIDVVAEYLKKADTKQVLNLVVVGHVDAGKSTLMGHLLYDLGNVDERTMRKYERESEKIGKGSFAYAWVLDETTEERNKGITMDVAVRSFETPHRRFTLLDAPGHRDFIPNMISGAAQADVSILVVDATRGEFESGFDHGGQTREHALLVRSLGVRQLIVAVNKLDTSDWSKERFEEISNILGNFLVQHAKFPKESISFVPCSGLTGENLLKRNDAKLQEWYKGPTLVEAIDSLAPPERNIEKPLRLSIVDVFKGAMGPGVAGGSNAITCSGKIQSGTIQMGESLICVPCQEVGVVKHIEVNDDSQPWAVAGDNVTLSLTGIDPTHVFVGNVLCTAQNPIHVTSHFTGEIVVFDLQVPITLGTKCVFHYQSSSEPATISKLHETINSRTGEVEQVRPRRLISGCSARVSIKLERPVCLDTFKENKELGRFTLRNEGRTIAAGIVVSLTDRLHK